jgi:hypothetical protein
VFSDFYTRFKAAGWTSKSGIEVHDNQLGQALEPWETARSLWILMQRRFFSRS